MTLCAAVRGSERRYLVRRRVWACSCSRFLDCASPQGASCARNDRRRGTCRGSGFRGRVGSFRWMLRSRRGAGMTGVVAGAGIASWSEGISLRFVRPGVAGLTSVEMTLCAAVRGSERRYLVRRRVWACSCSRFLDCASPQGASCARNDRRRGTCRGSGFRGRVGCFRWLLRSRRGAGMTGGNENGKSRFEIG